MFSTRSVHRTGGETPLFRREGKRPWSEELRPQQGTASMGRSRIHRVMTRQKPPVSLLALAWACMVVVVSVPLAEGVPPQSIWVFGDDYVDTGNTGYMKNPIRNCALPQFGGKDAPGNGRCSNGQLVVDQLARQMKLPSPGPFLGPKEWQTNGVNFATAGSGALNTTNPGGGVPLAAQVAQFKQYLLLNQTGNLTDALIVISVGMNDYMQLILQGKDPVGVIDSVVPQIASAIEQIYTVSGAYRFIVLSVPPIGCIPLMRAAFNCPPNNCLSNLNSLTIMHESRLDYFLTVLAKRLPIFFSRFSVSKATVDTKSGFPGRSPWAAVSPGWEAQDRSLLLAFAELLGSTCSTEDSLIPPLPLPVRDFRALLTSCTLPSLPSFCPSAAFSQPWDVACGSRGAQGQIYGCGQNVTYQNGPTNELWTIGPGPITGYDYWWYDWINPTQNAHYSIWVSMWLGSSATWPLSVMGLYFK